LIHKPYDHVRIINLTSAQQGECNDRTMFCLTAAAAQSVRIAVVVFIIPIVAVLAGAGG
jgi:hypothetical protein